MIHAIGTDIVKISRMEKVISRTEGFVKRVFSPAEADYCLQKALPAQHFASCFAAKESFIKALGAGLSAGMRFVDFELLHADSGAPYMNLSGATRELFDKMCLKSVHVSVSHDTDYAIATVIIEK